MLLDRIDIDTHGPLSRVELGPLAEHLNVICGPEGSGKTAIARFVRDSLVRRRYPLGMMNSSTGRVVWADQNGKVHCRREQDGTSEGRRTIEFESRGDHSDDYRSLKHSWLSDITGNSGASRAAVSIQIPESIVDCVITDTAVTNVARVVSACIRNGLDSPETYRTLPLAEDRRYLDRDGVDSPGPTDRHAAKYYRSLRAQLADVEAELARIERPGEERQTLVARREALLLRLQRSRPYRGVRGDGTRGAAPLRIEQLRRRQIELNRWITELDAQLAHARERDRQEFAFRSGDGPYADYRESFYRRYAESVDETLRQRLDDLDTQMIRWRRTLMEVRGLRDALLREDRFAPYAARPIEPSSYVPAPYGPAAYGPAAYGPAPYGSAPYGPAPHGPLPYGHRSDGSATYRPSPYDPLSHGTFPYGNLPTDDVIRRRRRLDGFLHAVDRYERDRQHRGHHWAPAYDDTYPSQRYAEEIQSRLDAATRQIDWLLHRYRDGGLRYDDWYRSLSATDAYRSAGSLEETLQAVRRDLREAAGLSNADGDARRRYQSYQETLLGVPSGARRIDPASQLDELHRSERWLVAAIEQLTSHRDALLRDFTPAGVACPESVTPPSIARWDAAGYSAERAARVSELRRVNAQLKDYLSRGGVDDDYQSSPRWYDTGGTEGLDDRYDPMTGKYTFDKHHVVDDRPTGSDFHASWIDDEAIRGELRRIDETLARLARIDSLRSRRDELLRQLQVVRHAPPNSTPLAEDASRWLVRLSAGRLRRIEWDPARVLGPHAQSDGGAPRASDAAGAPISTHTGVRIDGRDEADCTAADRALGSLAVRLAAGDLLARTGRTVPLVVETSRELLDESASRYAAYHHGAYDVVDNPYSLRGFDHQYHGTPLAFYRYGDHQDGNHPIASALYDYSQPGRQVVLLTSDVNLSDQIGRSGGRRFDLHGQSIVHPHRPLWRSHYQSENYVGPYPHAQGFSAVASLGDANRNFDVAWRETYGIGEYPDLFAGGAPNVNRADIRDGDQRSTDGVPARPVRTDWAADGASYRDGYYYANSYTTRPNAVRATVPSDATRQTATDSKPDSPFFLTVDSPIDQAPSIDAIAAARLRGLNVSHINHLMQQDANRLSDALGLASVDAVTVRRWQSECRLVCRVPQLRGFDARILVGCGITDPGQLAAIAPIDLLDRVKDFLATEQGQRVLLSGSSYELSRITSWIAAANSNANSRNQISGERVGFRKYRTSPRQRDADFDSYRYEYESAGDGAAARHDRARRNRGRSAIELDRDRYDIDGGTVDSAARGDGRSGRSNRSRSDGRGNAGYRRSGRDLVRLADERIADAYREADDHEYDDRDVRSRRTDRAGSRGGRRRSRKSRSATESSRTRTSQSRSANADSSRSSRSREYSHASNRSDAGVHETEYRFYLQRDSDVVDAPSIGARMAERLGVIGIHTVDDLLQCDPESTATELDYRKVDADTIVAWQQQAALVCRVPMLRGHDAQLLVAAQVTTPEELVTYTPDDLFALIDPISHSSEGKRILRGGSLPDLEEITDWITYAGHQRELIAA